MRWTPSPAVVDLATALILAADENCGGANTPIPPSLDERSIAAALIKARVGFRIRRYCGRLNVYVPGDWRCREAAAELERVGAAAFWGSEMNR